MSKINKIEYNSFLVEIKTKIQNSRIKALKSVNKEMINLYWELGKSIVERQERNGWGKAIVENIANDLQQSFPSIQGFSSQNLWRMRKFYMNYKDNEKLAPLVREISWSHNMLIVFQGSDYNPKLQPLVAQNKYQTSSLAGRNCRKTLHLQK